MALAHIEAEVDLEQRYAGAVGARALYSTAAMQDLHRALFGRLMAADLITPENEPIVPGQLRQRDVRVGQHVAPAFASVPIFLDRWASFYGSVRRGEAALVAWIDYVLDTCLDQVGFMADMLDFATMKARIEACLVFEATVVKSGVRQEALRGLHYLFPSGEDMARGDFKAMLGESERGATDVLGALLKRGLLKSDSPQGKVRFGLPQHALRFLFPRLWPEAEADSACL